MSQDKSMLCINFFVRKDCKFGNKCRYAHNQNEIKKPKIYYELMKWINEKDGESINNNMNKFLLREIKRLSTKCPELLVNKICPYPDWTCKKGIHHNNLISWKNFETGIIEKGKINLTQFGVWSLKERNDWKESQKKIQEEKDNKMVKLEDNIINHETLEEFLKSKKEYIKDLMNTNEFFELKDW